MRIGELAADANVNVQTVRYYERRGLLQAPRRAKSGFRTYDPETVRRIRFIRRAQSLGFTLDEIRDLLGLWTESGESCSAVEKRASATLRRIATKMEDLRHMSDALTQYVSACRGKSQLNGCPLLKALGELDEANA